MGIIKKYIEGKKKEYAERKAYRDIVAKRTQAAARQVYAEESVKQARLMAQRKAIAQYNQPKKVGIGKQIGSFLYNQAEKYTRPQKKMVKPTRVKTMPQQSAPDLSFNDMFGRGMNAPISKGKKKQSSNEVTTKDMFGW